MFKEPAETGDRSADATPELADQLCVLLGGKPSANAGRRAGLAKHAESPGPLTAPIPPASTLPDASPIPPTTAIPDIPNTLPRSEDPNDRMTTSPVATGGLSLRNRHTPRLCVACEAPLGSQDGACWQCGNRCADRHEQRVEPERQTQSDADRWTEGGGLVMEESSSSTSPAPIPPAGLDWVLGTSVPPRISPSDAPEPLPKLPRQMAANVVFQVHDGRGAEMLAELEERTSHRSTVTPSGEREYELSAAEVDVGGFDPILGLIDTGWRDHLSLTQLPTN